VRDGRIFWGQNKALYGADHGASSTGYSGNRGAVKDWMVGRVVTHECWSCGEEVKGTASYCHCENCDVRWQKN
jgi:hypothetical protein